MGALLFHCYGFGWWIVWILFTVVVNSVVISVLDSVDFLVLWVYDVLFSVFGLLLLDCLLLDAGAMFGDGFVVAWILRMINFRAGCLGLLVCALFELVAGFIGGYCGVCWLWLSGWVCYLWVLRDCCCWYCGCFVV